MRKTGDEFRTIWQKPGEPEIVQIIDQRRLPHEYVVHDLARWQDGAEAISRMLVRGAPLIGATAAWSLYLAALETSPGDDTKARVRQAAAVIRETRPTAVNLGWAIERVLGVIEQSADDIDLAERLEMEANAICAEDIDISRSIGNHGVGIIEQLAERKPGGPINVLTHCNAGSLATINYGTATAPIYFAHDRGIDVHVWVDETRPRNQGSQLTAWELAENNVPHTLIVDNAGGHLMQHGLVDVVITGTDRTTRTGDVANKIGTYLKALAARDNDVPFYVALPSTTIDWNISDGLAEIPIEEREPEEVSRVYGRAGDSLLAVDTVASKTEISNFAFDVTPSKLVTGLITERGVCTASETGLLELFPEYGKSKH
ncbi:MAG: S-methyl-5-thioribose-1-phosphate isomerase [Woeseiaceae bacterium]